MQYNGLKTKILVSSKINWTVYCIIVILSKFLIQTVTNAQVKVAMKAAGLTIAAQHQTSENYFPYRPKHRLPALGQIPSWWRKRCAHCEFGEG